MTNGHILGSISPSLNHAFAFASGGTDVVFDWYPMQVPTGGCILKSFSATVMGTNGAAANAVDFNLWFATSINGVAPSTFGTPHTARTTFVNAAAKFRRNILGHILIDMSTTDDHEALVTYMVVSTRVGPAGSAQATGRIPEIMLQGEPDKDNPGYQTIWVAMEAKGAAWDFGTDVDLNQSGHQAASTAAVQIITSGTDPRLVFQPGDILMGHTGTVEMEVVSTDSATTMTVKNITDIIDHQEQLVIKNPINLRFGLQY